MATFWAVYILQNFGGLRLLLESQKLFQYVFLGSSRLLVSKWTVCAVKVGSRFHRLVELIHGDLTVHRVESSFRYICLFLLIFGLRMEKLRLNLVNYRTCSKTGFWRQMFEANNVLLAREMLSEHSLEVWLALLGLLRCKNEVFQIDFVRLMNILTVCGYVNNLFGRLHFLKFKEECVKVWRLLRVLRWLSDLSRAKWEAVIKRLWNLSLGKGLRQKGVLFTVWGLHGLVE